MSTVLVDPLVADEDQPLDETLASRLMDWVRGELVWYAGSFTVHLLGLSLLLLMGSFATREMIDHRWIEEAERERETENPTQFDKPFLF